jgi:AraC-like DNA-binding protein
MSAGKARFIFFTVLLSIFPFVPFAASSDSASPLKKENAGPDAPHDSGFGADTSRARAALSFGDFATKKADTLPAAFRTGANQKEEKLVAGAAVVKTPHAPDGRPHPGKFLIRLLVVLLFFIMIGCFICYLGNRADKTTFVTKTRLSIMDKEVQKACRYIEKNYNNSSLSVDSICTDLITGKPFLEALFKQELGIGVELFITHVRINRARMLLEKKPDLDASVAAAQTGFPTLDMFSAAFTSIVGAPFERYRDQQADHVS